MTEVNVDRYQNRRLMSFLGILADDTRLIKYGQII